MTIVFAGPRIVCGSGSVTSVEGEREGLALNIRYLRSLSYSVYLARPLRRAVLLAFWPKCFEAVWRRDRLVGVFPVANLQLYYRNYLWEYEVIEAVRWIKVLERP